MESLNIVFTGQDSVEVHAEPVPEPGRGQILVQTQRTLISIGTELICLRRNFEAGSHWENWVKYPFYPGYCNVGRVVQVGDGVENFKVGDRIASRTRHGQYVLANAESTRTVPIPDGITDEAAAWFGMACIAQIGVRRAEHTLGDTVVVIGLGLLGQLVVQYARLSGAREIIAVDTAQPRLDMAGAHGATQLLAMNVTEAREAITALTHGRFADVVYDITGHPAVFAPALGLVRRFGKLLLLGDAGTPSGQHLTPDVVTRGVRIIGAHDSYPPEESTDDQFWTHGAMTRLFFTYIERDQMRVDDLITHRYSPTSAPAAYQMLMTDRSAAMGVLFDWSSVS